MRESREAAILTVYKSNRLSALSLVKILSIVDFSIIHPLFGTYMTVVSR